MSKIVVIVGPTGVGKTKLSIAVAKYLKAEVINADSMQVYSGLDIGTAKIKEEEKEGIIHHLLDICEPIDDYNIYRYQRDGRKVLDSLLKKDKNVVIVGGSGLYIKSLLYDYKFNEETTCDTYDELSNEEILKEIRKQKDTDIHVNNRKRLIRELNKIRNNVDNKSNIYNKEYDFLLIGLKSDRDKLYDIVNKRVDLMIEEGLVLEASELYKQGINSKAIMTGIGYKELYAYFDGKISLEEAIELIKKNTRHFIKRQYTFFNHQMDVHYLDVDFVNFDKTINDAIEFIQNN